MTVLDDILAACRAQLEIARRRMPFDEVRKRAEMRRERRDFVRALTGENLRVIAELKRGSPSRGVLREDYRCRDLARGYEFAGAAALSVLTEEQFFRGCLADLGDTRGAVSLPVLRKDFILDEYQVYESVAAEADAVLLIVAALPQDMLCSLIELADALRIAALVEVHTVEELDRALACEAQVIGVNNRDLKTLEVDLATSLRLREKIARGHITVSESGIRTGGDLRRLSEAGFDAALVGEHFMTSPDPGRALANLLAEAASEVGSRYSP